MWSKLDELSAVYMLPSPQGRNVHISVSVLWDRLEVYVEGELMPIKLSIRENKLKTEDMGQGTLMLHFFPWNLSQISIVAFQKWTYL